MAAEVHHAGAGRGRRVNCLDCRERDWTVPAVGICLTCGAAICQAHAATSQEAQGPAPGGGRASRRRAWLRSAGLRH
ncbi:DUF2180 family protein [Streptomyces klenkii]